MQVGSNPLGDSVLERLDLDLQRQLNGKQDIVSKELTALAAPRQQFLRLEAIHQASSLVIAENRDMDMAAHEAAVCECAPCPVCGGSIKRSAPGAAGLPSLDVVQFRARVEAEFLHLQERLQEGHISAGPTHPGQDHPWQQEGAQQADALERAADGAARARSELVAASMELLATLQGAVKDSLLDSQATLDQTDLSVSRSTVEMALKKFRQMEATVMVDLYRPEEVEALRHVRQEIEQRVERLEKELHKARQALVAYTQMGPEFHELVPRYRKLCRELEQVADHLKLAQELDQDIAAHERQGGSSGGGSHHADGLLY